MFTFKDHWAEITAALAQLSVWQVLAVLAVGLSYPLLEGCVAWVIEMCIRDRHKAVLRIGLQPHLPLFLHQTLGIIGRTCQGRCQCPLQKGAMCIRDRGGTGLHPQTLALVGIVAVAHRDAVIVRGAAVGIQIVHQLLQRLFKALLAAAGHAAGEDLAVLEQDHGLESQQMCIRDRELEDKYPDLTPKERENAFVKENGTTFLMKIGAPLDVYKRQA